MGFQVFTPAESKKDDEVRRDKDAGRARVILDTTKELLQAQKDAEDDFQATMERQRREAAEWFEDNQAKKKELAEEVMALEKRRKDALMPLLIKSEDIHSVEEALRARALELDAKESSLEEESRLLMSRIDDISTREQTISKKEDYLARSEKTFEGRKSQILEDSHKLSNRMEQFEKDMAEREMTMAYRQSELDARENLYKGNEERLIEREREIEAGKRLLEDQRLVLEKGFAELRRLQEKHANSRLPT